MTQSQREALLDLLHIAMLTDSHISLKEESELERSINAIGWDSQRPREIHLLNSMAKARQATESAERTNEYIATRTAKFINADDQNKALSMLTSLLSSDGEGAEEIKFIAQIRELFSHT